MNAAAPHACRMRICISPGMLRLAVLDSIDGGILGYRVFYTENDILPGMVFIGRVARIDADLDAAFVDIGAHQAALLPAQAAGYAPGQAPPTQRGIAQRVREGERVLVQVTRAPERHGSPGVSQKGARVTTRLRFAGKYLVHTPCEPGINFSNDIAPDRHDDLRAAIAPSLTDLRGVILREPAAQHPSGSHADLGAALDSAHHRWRQMATESKRRQKPGPVAPLLAIWEAVVDSWIAAEAPETGLEIVGSLSLPETRSDLIAAGTAKGVDMEPFLVSASPDAETHFDAVVMPEVETLLEPAVPLPGGGSILVGHTPALTAIDVNSGTSSGGKAQTPADLAHKTNLEAAATIARTVAARDIGGRIVVDFIGMEGRSKKAGARRQEVRVALLHAFARDRMQVDVSELADSGLLVINRQNSGLAVHDRLTTACARCSGTGRVPDPTSAALDALCTVVRQTRFGNYRRPAVQAHPAVVAALADQVGARSEAEYTLGHAIQAMADPAMRPGQFEIVEERRS